MKATLRFVVFVTLMFTTTFVVAQDVSIIPTPQSAVFHNDKYSLTAPISVDVSDDTLLPLLDLLIPVIYE